MKDCIAFILIFVTFSVFGAENCEKKPRTLEKDSFKVDLASYLDKDTAKHILIIPPTGGTNFLDRRYAKALCDAGFNAHILEHWTEDDEYSTDLELHQRFYWRAQKAIGIVMEDLWVASYIGILGTSVGGLHAANAMGIYDRLKGAFVVAGGADIASIVVNSDQQAMIDLGEERFKRFRFKNKAEYIEKLRAKLDYDPLRLGPLYVGKDLGMVIADEDETVPVANQLKLKELWKPKTVLHFGHGHFLTILRTWLFETDTIVKFFKESASSPAKMME